MLYLLVNIGFQVLFHSPPGVLFTFPSQYSFAIGHQGIFRVGGWSLLLPTGFLVSRRTPDPAACTQISPTGFSPSSICFPKTVRLSLYNDFCSPQPRSACTSVCPVSPSLAATKEIDVSFSSCRYLDVSVHDVPLVRLFIQRTMTEVLSAGFPHSDISGSLAVCAYPKLFAAFCVLHRFLMPRHSPFALLA